MFDFCLFLCQSRRHVQFSLVYVCAHSVSWLIRIQVLMMHQWRIWESLVGKQSCAETIFLILKSRNYCSRSGLVFRGRCHIKMLSSALMTILEKDNFYKTRSWWLLGCWDWYLWHWPKAFRYFMFVSICSSLSCIQTMALQKKKITAR